MNDLDRERERVGEINEYWPSEKITAFQTDNPNNILKINKINTICNLKLLFFKIRSKPRWK